MDYSVYWHKKTDIPNDRIKEIRDLLENAPKTADPAKDYGVELIKVDGILFRKIFIMNREYLFKGDFTADPDENDYLTSDNYLSFDGLAGFSITKDKWLVSMFSNRNETGFLECCKDFIRDNTEKLVCITTEKNRELSDMYRKALSFNIAARTADDTMIMRKYYSKRFMDNFVKEYGNPYHTFLTKKKPEGKIPVIDGYFKAYDYVDGLI